jgi:hypothetical protein
MNEQESQKQNATEPYYNEIISMLNLKLNKEDCILALDKYGVIYCWKVNTNFYTLSSDIEDLVEFSDYKVYYPNICLNIKDSLRSSKENLFFTKMDILDDNFYISGEFNPVYFNKNLLEKAIFNKPFVNKLKIISLGSEDISILTKHIDMGINNFTINRNLGILTIFSENGNLYFYEKDIFIKNYTHSKGITAALLLDKHDRVIFATVDGLIHFINYKTLQYAGLFNPNENKFYTEDIFSNIYKTQTYACSCIVETDNYLVILFLT